MDERICVSIAEQSVEKCISALKGQRFAEIRIDALSEPSVEDIKRIFSLPLKLVATCRPGKVEEEKRKNLLLAAIDSGASYVDIEIETKHEYKKELVEAAKKKGCKIIISYHNYSKTPSFRQLLRIIERCFKSGADIAKIACKVNSKKDNIRLIRLLELNKRLIVIGMGEKGKITRVLAPLLGAEFTFASPAKGKETAEGQMAKELMEKLMGELKDG